MPRKTLTLLCAAVCLLIASAAFAQVPQPDGQKPPEDSKQDSAANPFLVDLDSLANMKVTTASKFSEQLSDAPSDITVVSQDELQRFGGLTLAEILNRVAGLNGSSSYFQDRSTIAARGDQSRLDSGHILLLINGRPVREVIEGGVDSDILESFPVSILEQIEVIKGPGSVLYGSDAFSGVINLITKKAVSDSISVRAAGGLGSAATTSAEAMLVRGDFSLVAAGQYHQFPLWSTIYGSPAGPTNPESFKSASLRDDGAGGYLGINYKGFSFMSSYTGVEEGTFVRGYIGDVRWKKGFADLGYSLKVSRKWQMNFNFTYNRTVQDAPDYPSILRDSHEALLEWTNFYTFSESDRLTFGALFSHDAGVETVLSKPSFIDANGQRSSGAFYAQYEHKLTDDLKLIGGFQANKIGNIALNVVPRFGILWNPAAHVTLKALYGGAFRAPSLDETLLTFPALKGNPNLVPETVGTLDLQASYQTHHLLLSADYFHSRQNDLILKDANVFPNIYMNSVTPAIFQGVDSEGKYYFRKSWLLMGSALYQANHDSDITELSPIPAFSAKAGLSYQSPSGADVSVFDAYQGHIPGYSLALNPRPNAFHSVSAHLRIDLTRRWVKTDHQGIAAFLYADNLTNTPVWLPAWGSGQPNTIPVNRGRTIFFGMEVWRKAE
jgi:outer membrane receptor protein involved in Fe transport